MEIVRYGRFVVLDRGVEADDRYAVVEYDSKGPILRAGPYRMVQTAVERCQQLSFRADLQEKHDVAQE